MDIKGANRDAYRTFVDTYGWDALLRALDVFTANGLDLYTVSRDWREGGYLLKAKGAKGDLLVRFSDDNVTTEELSALLAPIGWDKV